MKMERFQNDIGSARRECTGVTRFVFLLSSGFSTLELGAAIDSLSSANQALKEKLYDSVLEKKSDWKEDVPEQIVTIIEEEWETVEKFANQEDQTTRIVGMKFPKEGYSK